MAPPDSAHPFAWRAWTFAWPARPGVFELLTRATDEAGSQPVEAEWNRQGMANNLRVRLAISQSEFVTSGGNMTCQFMY